MGIALRLAVAAAALLVVACAADERGAVGETAVTVRLTAGAAVPGDTDAGADADRGADTETPGDNPEGDREFAAKAGPVPTTGVVVRATAPWAGVRAAGLGEVFTAPVYLATAAQHVVFERFTSTGARGVRSDLRLKGTEIDAGTLNLPPPGGAIGRVTLEGEPPGPRGTVLFVPGEGVVGSAGWTGGFRFDDEYTGLARPWAWSPGYAPRRFATADYESGKNHFTGNLRLLRADLPGRISGRIRRVGAADHRGIRVLVRGTAGTDAVRSAVTDPGGRFLLADIPTGLYTLELSAADRVTRRIFLVPASPEGYEIPDTYMPEPPPVGDLDRDNVPDSLDPDQDGDGFRNEDDAAPTDPWLARDLDGDGIDDQYDLDTDGDGATDAEETAFGSDPRDPNSLPAYVCERGTVGCLCRPIGTPCDRWTTCIGGRCVPEAPEGAPPALVADYDPPFDADQSVSELFDPRVFAERDGEPAPGAPPLLSVPLTIEDLTTPLDGSTAIRVELRNPGGDLLVIDSIVFTPDDPTIWTWLNRPDGYPVGIGAGDAGALGFRFDRKDTAEHTATVRIVSNAADNPDITVTIRARYAGDADVALTPVDERTRRPTGPAVTVVDFGAVPKGRVEYRWFQLASVVAPGAGNASVELVKIDLVEGFTGGPGDPIPATARIAFPQSQSGLFAVTQWPTFEPPVRFFPGVVGPVDLAFVGSGSEPVGRKECILRFVLRDLRTPGTLFQRRILLRGRLTDPPR